ncbi:MAG: response regulator [Candidatus Sungbacteria bacterium]|uniref:Response regulator n=1 Tax=Candidatus Sungiibacteriota bacterium TaxID=2750080 RepID=A0A932YW03_9BACT|nr:response regulator [Candidatus Sungbacteria bacterium]
MKKILFIEDEPALQQTLGDFLKEQGYEVIPALDGEAGFAAIRSERPDLILLDLILPKKHGFDVFREMRGDPELAAIPVIVLTNVESGDAIKQASELGAKAYLVKTNYSLDEVLEKVKGVIGGP